MDNKVTRPRTDLETKTIQFPKQMDTYDVWPRTDGRGVDLISDRVPFGKLSYDGPSAVVNAIEYALQRSRFHDAVIRVYDAAGNVIGTHEHNGDSASFRSQAAVRLSR